ncbi:helix-turn-helix transcriptional regulator [Lacisediminimonas profundi]|uniref:helix-turn-helix transcriptional regulator n=1 Tax=Lacisediminimonas profundi TaxID=2603856 RepID=UPI00124B75BA|nr:helix-turn-helix transcriptional regulator [Lacisediminimonas profundi]
MNPSQQAPTLIEILSSAQSECGKPDAEISSAIGSDRANIFAMIKNGSIKLPVSFIPLLAETLSLDPAYLFRLTLSESMPDVLKVLDTLHPHNALTTNERELIDSYRYLTKGRDVRPTVIDANSLIALVAA